MKLPKGINCNVSLALQAGDDRCFYHPAYPGLANNPPVLCNGHWMLLGPSLRHTGRTVNDYTIAAFKMIEGAFKRFKAIGVVTEWSHGADTLAIGDEAQIPSFEQVIPGSGQYVELDPLDVRIDFTGDPVKMAAMYSNGCQMEYHGTDLSCRQVAADPVPRVRCGIDLAYLIPMLAMGARLWVRVQDKEGDTLDPILITGQKPDRLCGLIMPLRLE